MIEVLFGPIASGKSTYASQRARDGAITIVMAIHANNYNLYDQSLKPLYKALQLTMICQAVALGRDVVIDSTGLKRSTRDRFRTMAVALEVESKIVYFRDGVFSGELDGHRRFKADPRGLTLEDWVAVGEKHAAQVEPVNHHEEPFDITLDVPWEARRCTPI